jgi:hypothetical protein
MQGVDYPECQSNLQQERGDMIVVVEVVVVVALVKEPLDLYLTKAIRVVEGGNHPHIMTNLTAEFGSPAFARWNLFLSCLYISNI